MRVFVTGASGWIGSAVVTELLGAGHHVVGLARSDASAESLAAAGADVARGTIDDLDGLRAAADAADGVIHLAFKHELAFSGDFQGAADADRRAVEAFGEALAGSDRPFLIASGTVGLAPGRVATEQDGHGPDPAAAALGGGPLTRLGTAQFTLGLASRRRPLFGRATSSHVSRRGGPRVHGDPRRHRPSQGRVRLSRRRLQPLARHPPSRYRAALPPCPGTGTGRVGAARGGGGGRADPCNVAEVIGRHLDLPVAAIAPEDAGEHFGFLSAFIGADVPASSECTRELLGWQPTHPGLIDDLDQGHYFHPPAG